MTPLRHAALMPPPRMRLRDLPDETNHVSGQVLDAAIAVHAALGPGLLENAYHRCLYHELTLRGLKVAFKPPLDLSYKELVIEAAYFPDLIVEDRVVVELKTADALIAEHEAQLLTYLRLSGCRLGILLNFHAPLMREGFLRRAL